MLRHLLAHILDKIGSKLRQKEANLLFIYAFLLSLLIISYSVSSNSAHSLNNRSASFVTTALVSCIMIRHFEIQVPSDMKYGAHLYFALHY